MEENQALSASTVSFIICIVLRVTLPDATRSGSECREEKWGCRVKKVEQVLADVYARRLYGLEKKLACSFKLLADMVGSEI